MKNLKGNISVIVSFVIVACVVALGVYGFMYKANNTVPVDITTSDTTHTVGAAKAPATQQKQAQPTKSMEQVAKNGDTLVMNYTGRLTNGTVFDSNVDPKFGHVTPFEFKLGAGQVIKGWDEGLLGMKVGEKKTLTIPPEKGYGDKAVSTIPANSTLIFDVELVGIK